jgi:hypothetical protein
VPNFRCHILDEHRDILFPADIVAETVSAAIQQGFEILESNNLRPLPSRQAVDGYFPSRRRSRRNSRNWTKGRCPFPQTPMR